MAFYNTCCHLGKQKRLRDGISNRWHPIFARERHDGKCEIFATPNSDTKEVWIKHSMIQKLSKVSFELALCIYIYKYIYIYVRTKSIYPWQMYDKPWNQIPWSFSTPGPYVCRMSCTSTSNGWMNLVVTGAQPGEQPGKAGAALPGGGATARDPKCFFDGTMTRMSFCCFEVLALPSKTLTNPGPQSLLFFFCPASTWGLCRRFRIWSNDVPTPGCQCPIRWAVSCVAADVLFRVFHLFFQKIALERFFWFLEGGIEYQVLGQLWYQLPVPEEKSILVTLLVYPPAPLLQSLRWRDS